jgi:alpha-glucosidase (family GH31 glycosyl hydrolase)
MNHRLVFAFMTLTAPFVMPMAADATVFRSQFTSGSSYLVVEVLDDDLAHFEVASGTPPATTQPLYTSPMVFKTDYTGPTSVTRTGNTIETNDMRLEIDAGNLCINILDKKKQNANLTTLCPKDLSQPLKGLDINPSQIQNIYGLGQEFKNPGAADGDWTALGVREGQEFGNSFRQFQGGATGNVQVPVYYAIGRNNLNYALMMDNVYKQRWDFTKFWWQARMFGDQLRFYVMTGADLPDLRRDYMELTGRSPVPPRKALGLWVSEFGYDNWNQIDDLLAGLRRGNFPVDGFVLDLNWFGGVALNQPNRSAMGRLNWDENQEPLVADGRYFFPNPADKVRQYAADQVRLAAIEESYLANTTNTFREMPTNLLAYRRTNGGCDRNQQSNPTEINASDFWGIGRMIDWSDPAAGKWWHDQRRFPNLVRLGINVHWTDLGEPERFDGSACYEGVESTATGVKNGHADIHNLYNLLWNRSIWQGYADRRGQTNNLGVTNPRPFTLTRSGAAGTQRYGTAMWSADIGSNLESLATHMNAQMHMSFAGIDYYGADIGGFRKESMPYNDRQGAYRGYEDEIYTQWFANGAWFDVPVRPHTDKELITSNPPYATSPHLIGKVESNLANIRQRYELIPYYYSLAHRAHLLGEPIVSAPVFYYQNDPNVRQMGHEKLIGRDLLIGITAKYGEYERDLYLPAGRWVNYHTNEWVDSRGQSIANVPTYRNGLFRLPAFVKAGAILPLMVVDDQTKDAFGIRKNNTVRNELVAKVYPDSTPTNFTLYEDDGETLSYGTGDRPVYLHRTTQMEQRQVNSTTIEFKIDAAVNVNSPSPFPGAVTTRQNVVQWVVNNARATRVTLNGSPLQQFNTQAEFESASSGWWNAGNNLIVAKSSPLNVSTVKTFTAELTPVTATTSVNFVCDRGFTNPGESVYIAGNLTALGEWNPAKAIKLDPNVYYQYIIDGRSNPGPAAPVWTGVLMGLAPNTTFEWKCLKRREDGMGTPVWQAGNNNSHTTGPMGYAGRTYGALP